MKTPLILALTITLTATTGCRTPFDVSKTSATTNLLPDNRRFPKTPRFTIKPEVAPESTRLDFNAVYYCPNDTLPGAVPGVTGAGGNYYRFWPNGRVLVTFGSSPPSAIEADGFRSGYLGYYRADGDQVEMELFAPVPNTHRWAYFKDIAVIEGGNLTTSLSRSGKHRAVFVKRPLQGLKRMPDW